MISYITRVGHPQIEAPPFGTVFLDEVEIRGTERWGESIEFSSAKLLNGIEDMSGSFRRPRAGKYRLAYLWFGPNSEQYANEAMRWSEYHSLYRSSPYHLFAVARKHPAIQPLVGMHNGGPGMLSTETVIQGTGHKACAVCWSRKGSCWATLMPFDERREDKTLYLFSLDPWEHPQT